MKAIFHSKNFDIELEGSTHEDLFNGIIDLQNSGLLETHCGHCKQENIYMRTRKCEFTEKNQKTGKETKKNATFYEWKCRTKGCWATLTMHMNNEEKKGSMYKIAYTDEGGKRDYTKGGWVRYVPENKNQKDQNDHDQPKNNDEGFDF